MCVHIFHIQTKTGGMVVWRKKDTLVIYRGCNYQSSSKFFPKMRPCSADRQETLSSDHMQPDLEESSSYQYKSFESPVDEKMSGKDEEEDCIQTGTFQETSMSCQPTSRSLYEKEADRLLDGLGPRFIDWWMHKPLPVDADLLPEVVPGFKAPIRRCPPHTRSKLTDDELTFLRKFARSLPTHFVLGITFPAVICQFFPKNGPYLAMHGGACIHFYALNFCTFVCLF